MAVLNFDAATVDPQQSFDPMPAGWYQGIVTGSEMKPTKAGDGSRLNLEITIQGGEFHGRKVWDGLNLANPNPVAVEIAFKQLSALCHATGVIQCADSNQLHGIPFECKVKLVPAKDGYDAKNDISGYRVVNGGQQAPPVVVPVAATQPAPFSPAAAAAPAQPAPANPAPAQPAAGTSAPPWQNGAPTQPAETAQPASAQPTPASAAPPWAAQ